MKFRQGIGRPERDNAIDLFVRKGTKEYELRTMAELLEEAPESFLLEEKQEWLKALKNVTLGSDAFFPFRDNIGRAYKSGVKYIVQPSGSVREDIVIEACNKYGMVMFMTGLRLFHH